jgi:hypothetical protein
MGISLKWINVADNAEYEGDFGEGQKLSSAKIRAMAGFGITPPQPGKYEVGTAAVSEALDESTKLRDLGLSDGSTLYLREAGSVADITFVCSSAGTSCVEPCGKLEVLGDVEMRVLPQLGLSLEDKDVYGVGESDGGAPLDESDTLSGLGVFEDGKTLYTVSLASISLTWFNCMTGARFTDSYGTALTLGAAKYLSLAALGIPPSDGANYKVGKRPGMPLDESLTLQAHGLADGTTLYVWRG